MNLNDFSKKVIGRGHLLQGDLNLFNGMIEAGFNDRPD